MLSSSCYASKPVLREAVNAITSTSSPLLCAHILLNCLHPGPGGQLTASPPPTHPGLPLLRHVHQPGASAALRLPAAQQPARRRSPAAGPDAAPLDGRLEAGAQAGPGSQPRPDTAAPAAGRDCRAWPAGAKAATARLLSARMRRALLGAVESTPSAGCLAGGGNDLLSPLMGHDHCQVQRILLMRRRVYHCSPKVYG